MANQLDIFLAQHILCEFDGAITFTYSVTSIIIDEIDLKEHFIHVVWPIRLLMLSFYNP